MAREVALVGEPGRLRDLRTGEAAGAAQLRRPFLTPDDGLKRVATGVAANRSRNQAKAVAS